MPILRFASKKQIKDEFIGKDIRPYFQETSMFGSEYPENGTGKITGSNRPWITGIRNPKTGRLAREFFATVTIENHLIVKVS